MKERVTHFAGAHSFLHLYYSKIDPESKSTKSTV